MKILAISPYRESTKIALYKYNDLLWIENQLYDSDELQEFSSMISQEDFRFGKIKEMLEAKGVPLGSIGAFVATGGMLHSLGSGTYNITLQMLQDLLEARYGEIPSNLGAPLAVRLASRARSRFTYVVDPPVVDDMNEVAHLTGLPKLRRKAAFHALNMRSAAWREIKKTEKSAEECNFVICYLDEDISIAAFSRGKFSEANDIYNASGVMSMCGSGDIPPGQLLDLCLSGKYTPEELKLNITSKSGLRGILGVGTFSDMIRQVTASDRKAMLVFDAFMLQLVKAVGACAGVLDGRVDAVILTGGFASEEFFIAKLKERIGWIAPVAVYPGNDEILPLIEGVLRVMMGVEEAKGYS